MFAAAYRRMFLGLLLVFLDFRIQFIDILPDFLGYILVYQALGKLTAQHPYFSKGKPFALVLVFLSLVTIIEPPNSNLLENSLNEQQLGWILVGQGNLILDLFLFFWLCQGICLLATERGLDVLREKATFRWKFYLIVTSILLVYTPFTLNLDPAWNMLMIVFLVLQFIILLLLLGLIRTAQRELAE